MTSQVTGVSIVCSTICSDPDLGEHESSMSLAFVCVCVCVGGGGGGGNLPVNTAAKFSKVVHDWVSLICGRNFPERQVSLVVMGIGLSFAGAAFYELIWTGLQHKRWTTLGQDRIILILLWSFYFVSERVPLIFTWWVLQDRSDLNHFEATLPTPMQEPSVSNKIVWSSVSNAGLRSSITRKVT